MSEVLRILVLEDRPIDAELMLREVRKAGIELTALRVETEGDFRRQLQEFRPGLILADYSLPAYDGMSALAVAQEECPDVPFILVSGTLGEDTAVESLHLGATDYILKQRIFRLGGAVRRALLEVEERNALKRSEQRLRASEMRYRRLFESAKDGVLILDAETGTVVDANPFLSQILGFSREQFLGKKVWELGLFKDIVANQANFLELQQKEYIRYEDMALETSDGRRIEVEFVSNVYLVDNCKVIQCNIRDITERKQAEGAIRLQSAALNAAANPIVITDCSGTISWVNAAFTVATGYSAEEALGKNPRELLKSGVHDQAFYKDLWDTILAGNVWHGEMTNRRKDGSLYPEEQTITPVKNARGEITHFVAIKQDLTQRKQMEAQFLHAQKMESVGRLAGGIAHDFNNMLSVILGTVDLILANRTEEDPLYADLQEVFRAGERAAGLTRQLLAFSRRQILQPKVLSLNTVLADLLSMLRRLLGEDITVTLVPGKDVSPVKVDPGQIEQVVANLAVNARDAMPTGGTLTIELQDVVLDEAHAAEHPSLQPGPYVMLAVSDTGIGMDEATRLQIFEPFFTTKGPGKGTGLGLSTVYGIVKQSGGSVRVSSEIGRGSTFKIYLPRAEGPAHTNGHVQSVAEARGSETILVVEDEAALRCLATRLLEPAGYTVLAAANGEEALVLIELHDGPVHLVLTDVVMPGMSGWDLAHRLSARHPETKVVFTSGYTDDAITHHGVLDDGTQFLSKPYKVAELRRKIREVLDSQGGCPTTR